MKFKEYVTELHNIGYGQARIAHEPRINNGTSLANPIIRSEINHRLKTELHERSYEVTSALQKIRKVLHRYFIDLPAGYELDPEGDEVFFEVEQFGEAFKTDGDYFYLYILYYLEDDGYYIFDVELVNEEELADILEDTGVVNIEAPEDEEDEIR